MTKKRKIILVSTEAWGTYFVSKHYYAWYLAKNNEVYFINPVAYPWKLKELFRSTINVEGVAKNLFVVNYANIVPKLGYQPWFIRKFIFKWLARRIKKQLNLPIKVDLVWSFDFTRFNDFGVWKASKTLLHIVEIFNHPHFHRSGKYKIRSVQTADIVVSIANIISEQVKPYVLNKFLQLNHGADIDGFTKAAKTKITLPGENIIKCSFVGNFQYSFDFDLLCQLADQNQNVDFIIIAPLVSNNLGNQSVVVSEGISKLKKHDNVYLVGGIEPSLLMGYLLQMDVNLILYKKEHALGHSNPHKLMAYFYSGKAIVSSFIDQYKDRPDLIYMANDNEMIPALFKKVASDIVHYNSSALQQYRRDFALQNSYDSNIDKVISLL